MTLRRYMQEEGLRSSEATQAGSYRAFLSSPVSPVHSVHRVHIVHFVHLIHFVQRLFRCNSFFTSSIFVSRISVSFAGA